MSVHITLDGNILIGSPNVNDTQGSIVVHSFTLNKTRILDEWGQANFSYFGFAVSSGYLNKNRSIFYVASAPKSNLQAGQVILLFFN